MEVSPKESGTGAAGTASTAAAVTREVSKPERSLNNPTAVAWAGENPQGRSLTGMVYSQVLESVLFMEPDLFVVETITTFGDENSIYDPGFGTSFRKSL